MNAGKIYLIRHGQTDGNGNQYVGWEDLPLNDTGREQAKAITEVLDGETVDGIYTSALNRAIATVQPLAGRKKLQIQTTQLLNEIDYGAYQGRLKSELQLKLRKDYRTNQLPGGECLHDVYLRVAKFLELLAPLPDSDTNLVIVAHYWSIRMLLGILQHKSFDEMFSTGGYKPANGTIYQVCYRRDSKGVFSVISERYLEPKSDLSQLLPLGSY